MGCWLRGAVRGRAENANNVVYLAATGLGAQPPIENARLLWYARPTATKKMHECSGTRAQQGIENAQMLWYGRPEGHRMPKHARAGLAIISFARFKFVKVELFN